MGYNKGKDIVSGQHYKLQQLGGEGGGGGQGKGWGRGV